MQPDLEQVLASLEDRVQKAVTNTTYTMSPPSRSIYAPENLDPQIKHLIPTTAPVRNLLPRSTGFGQVATWRVLTSRLDPQAGGTAVRLGFADAGTPNQTTQTYSLKTASYKNIGRDVELGRQALASNRGGNLEDMRSHEERIKALETVLGEEDIILTGDSSVNTTEFDGLAKSITTNSGTAALLTASGIGTYCQTLYLAGADPQVIVANPRQGQALADSLQGSGAIQRIAIDQQGKAVGGVALAKVVNPVNGTMIDFVPSRYVGGSDAQYGGGGNNGYAFLLTVKSPAGENWLEMEDLEPLSVYDVPTSNHSIVSRVYETTVLKVIAEKFQYKISGLA